MTVPTRGKVGPVTVGAVGVDAVVLTVLCESCRETVMVVTISDVPAFTRQAVAALIASAGSRSGRVRAICSSCAV